MIYFEMFYFFLNIICAWFMVGVLFLTFAIMARSVLSDTDEDEEKNGLWTWSNFVIILYLVLLIITFIVVIGVVPTYTNRTYNFLMIVFGMYMIVNTVFLAFFLVYEAFATNTLRTLVAGTLFMFSTTIISH